CNFSNTVSGKKRTRTKLLSLCCCVIRKISAASESNSSSRVSICFRECFKNRSSRGNEAHFCAAKGVFARKFEPRYLIQFPQLFNRWRGYPRRAPRSQR